MRRQGYRLDVHEEATSLCPYRNCRGSTGAHYFLRERPHRAVPRLHRSLTRSSSPTLHYEHALLPHVPWIFTLHAPLRPDGARPDLGAEQQRAQRVRPHAGPPVLAAPPAPGRRGGHAGRRMVARMKATALYDRAVVVVMADHGVSFRVGATDRRTIVPGTPRTSRPIPLFIKVPRQRRGRIDRSPDPHLRRPAHDGAADRPAVPRGLTGGRPGAPRRPATGPGEDPLPRAPRPLHLSERPAGGRTARRAPQDRPLRRGRRSLYASGRTAAARPGARCPVGAADGCGRRSTTRTTAGTSGTPRSSRPTSRAGSGAAPRSRRDVAVAMNGRIRGVSRSVRIRGQPESTTRAARPPRSFGRNRRCASPCPRSLDARQACSAGASMVRPSQLA